MVAQIVFLEMAGSGYANARLKLVCLESLMSSTLMLFWAIGKMAMCFYVSQFTVELNMEK